ncbi:MAG: hypothetical protein JSU07_03800 [Bacteroidetes bacterium]|nr:hypothetical protein [Bacteroidota bacterium]
MINFKQISTILFISFELSLSAQFSDKLKDGLKFFTDSKDSSLYLKLNITNQVWVRYTQTNPSTNVNGFLQNEIYDASIRRIRFVLSGKIADRVGLFVQFGQNNLNYLTPRKAQSFFHDITADYEFIKKHLAIGFGLNGWNGPSRFSNVSVSSITVLGPPDFQEVTNDTYDQFVRRLGFYAKGKLGKLDYRISLAKPFIIQTTSGITDPFSGNLPTEVSTFSIKPPKLVSQGYLMWQFFDQESNVGPAFTGTYLGKKKVLNIGAGFYFQKDAMAYTYSNTIYNPLPKVINDTMTTDLALFSADIYYDAPINKEKGTAVSFYASYSNYNYGKNFIKVSGADNPATGTSTYSTSASPTTYVATGTTVSNFNKASYGNALPYLGTGNILYAQAAYKFKNDLLKKHGTLQPYVNCQYAIYDRLAKPMYVWNVGINWLIHGHNSKFTLDYQDRPFFAEDNTGHLMPYSRYGQIVLQYQLAF